MGLNGVNWEKLYPQFLIYYSTSIKNNAPKRIETLRGKNSIGTRMIPGAFIILPKRAQ